MTNTNAARRDVVELRQYTLHPGQRDTLIDLFDTHFVDGQEAVGMHVVGQFRDLDDPDRFVWLRGFDNMPARAEALASFYYGPVWQAHSSAANATMIDSDNVLLLRPVRLGGDYPVYGASRPPVVVSESVVGITVLVHDGSMLEGRLDEVVTRAGAELSAAGGAPTAVFVSDPAENTFPVLPVRAENVVVWVSRFADDDAWAAHRDHLATSSSWQDDVLPELLGAATQPLQQLRLRPTAGSQLR
ncbi:MAG: family containing protein [Jatrophihabitans sp.]|nr:family containing protein [Jatrophihabitans sp.]